MAGELVESAQQDPDGSIFLPKTGNPIREFSGWEAEILLGRGIGRGLSYQEQQALYAELVQAKERILGNKALVGTSEL